MPGDDAVRRQAEEDAGLHDDRLEVELRPRPDGKIEEVPMEGVSIREVDGRLVKKKAVMLRRFCDGCGHPLHAPDIEARLDIETGLQGGYCQVCQKLNCRLCLRDYCQLCQKAHDTCRQCGRTCCKKCLFMGYIVQGEQKVCTPECGICKAERRRRAEEASRRAAQEAAQQGDGCVVMVALIVGFVLLASCAIVTGVAA